MLNSETLEVGIGMVFLFLLMSLICTALQEWLEGIFKWRAMDLERGVRTLLDDGDGAITSFLYRHPLVYSLFQGRYEPSELLGSAGLSGVGAQHMRLRARRNLPSYIPSASFSMAFLDLVGRGPVSDAQGDELDASSSPLSVAMLRQRAAALSSPHLRRVMLSAIDHSGGDMDKLRLHIEDWFNSTMTRAGGWYKRRTQAVLFTLGIVMACALNVDSLHIMQRLTADKAFRDVVVSQASVTSAQDPTKAEASSLKQFNEARNVINSVGMPVGWRAIDNSWGWVPRQLCVDELQACTLRPGALYGWLHVVAGWLISALAVMLGAPFWFDMLNKFMVVRSTIKPKEKTPQESVEEPPATPATVASFAISALEAQAPPALELPAPDDLAPTVSRRAASFKPNQWRPGYTNPNNEVKI